MAATAEHPHGPPHPNVWRECLYCNSDNHRCPGCGDWLYHGTKICFSCQQDLDSGRMA